MLENKIIINEDNLIYNYSYYKNKTKKNVIAVIKANAYGHGLVQVARILDSINAYMLAVENIKEGILLRQNNIKAPILILEPIEKSDLMNCYYYHLTPSITSLNQFNSLSKANFFSSLPFHLKIDSGMHRLGVNEEEAKIIYEKLKTNNNLYITGIYSHLIGKEKIEGYLKNQQEVFKRIVSIFKEYSLCIHLSSSSTLNNDLDITNAIRIGLGIYGLFDKNNTKQVLSLYSPIINAIKVRKDDYIGYNNSYKVKSDGYIYTSPIGYQSGLLSKYKFSPEIDNKKLSLAGKKCMNMTMLFSKNRYYIGQDICWTNEDNSLIDIASKNNVSIYELIVLLNSNIPRVIQ